MTAATITPLFLGVPLAGERRPTPPLTPRESEVLLKLTSGRTARAIARELGVSERTVRKHLEHVYEKLGVHDRLGAVLLALRTGDCEAGERPFLLSDNGRTLITWRVACTMRCWRRLAGADPERDLWDFWDDMRIDPSDAVARGAVGIGFAVTAILLWNQSGQRGNARLFGLLTLVWLVDEAGLREIGPLGAVALLVGGYVTVLGAAVPLRYPGPRLDPAARWFITVATIVATLLQVGLLVAGRVSRDRLGPREQPKNLELQTGFDLVVLLKSGMARRGGGHLPVAARTRWRSMSRRSDSTLTRR